MRALKAWFAQWRDVVLLGCAFALAALGGVVYGGGLFHGVAYYLPAVCMIGVVLLQLDLLRSIQSGGLVNIKARALDCVHWLLLVFLAVSGWMQSGATPWWFALQLLVLAIIAWQIGVGIGRQWRPTANEKKIGAVLALGAIALGVACGIVRAGDSSHRGWGWGLEAATSIIATMIVVWWIYADMQTFRVNASGYPRRALLKGLFCNALVVWYWAHIIVQRGGFNADALVDEMGLTFNTIVGNLIYFAYYFAYEYYRAKQQRALSVA